MRAEYDLQHFVATNQIAVSVHTQLGPYNIGNTRWGEKLYSCFVELYIES